MFRYARGFLILWVLTLCFMRLPAQQPMPHQVTAGSVVTYWVDSVFHAGSTFTWSVDSFVRQTGSRCAFTHLWGITGTFEISVRQISADGCAGELMTGEVTVTEVSPPSVSITVNLRDSCSGTPATFTAQTLNAGPDPYFQWFVNGIRVQETDNDTYDYIPEDDDLVFVNLLSDSLLMATSDALRITVIPPAGTPVFAAGPSSMRIPGTGTTAYPATAVHSTGITYSLDSASLAAGNHINDLTGEVMFTENWTGTTVITASAAGCNGPALSSHTVYAESEKPVLVITVNDTSKLYGDALPAFTVSYSGLMDGDDSPAVPPVITTTATAASPAGTYPVMAGSASDTSYTITYINGTLTVIPVPLSVIAENKTIVYGQALPPPMVRYLTLVNGDTSPDVQPVVHHTADASSNPGSYPIVVTGASDPDYIIRHVNGMLFILDKSIPEITWSDPADLIYGARLSGAQLNATSGITGTFRYEPPAGIRLDAGGAQVLSVTFTPDDNLRYTSVIKQVKINILSKPITITADRQTKEFRIPPDPDPEFTWSVDPPLEAGDSLTGSLSRISGEEPGEYQITAGTLSAGSNYVVTFISGILSIIDPGPKEIVVTADPGQGKSVGEPDPVYTYTHSPELDAGDTFTGRLSRVEGEAPGSYAITRGNLRAGAKYRVRHVSNPFTITEISYITITVQVDPGQGKEVGQADPPLTFTAAPALDPGDSFNGGLVRDPGEDKGTYGINRGTLSAPRKYKLVFIPEVFTIIDFSAIPITVAADPGQQKVIGQPDPAITFTVTPSNSGARFTGTLSRNPGEAAGTYPITRGTLIAGDKYITILSSPMISPLSTIT
jgi:hypothetical protein